MTQQMQTKLQAALEEFRKAMGYDEADMNVYINVYGVKNKKNKGNQLQTTASNTIPYDEEFDDGRVTLRLTINKDEIKEKAELPSVHAEPGKITDKYIKQATIVDKFACNLSKILNEVTE